MSSSFENNSLPAITSKATTSSQLSPIRYVVLMEPLNCAVSKPIEEDPQGVEFAGLRPSLR
jgi:hypothetical protein